LAALKNLVDYGRLLLLKGASLDIANNRGETPLETALRAESYEFATMLKSHNPSVQTESETPIR
jgi:ankyrin repeat protein